MQLAPFLRKHLSESKQQSLETKLKELYENEKEEQPDVISGTYSQQNFAYKNTSTRTSGDFLFIPLGLSARKFIHCFPTMVRRYLGLPVTSTTCNILPCEGGKTFPNGGNASHTLTSHSLISQNERHTAVKNAITALAVHTHKSSEVHYNVVLEKPIADYNATRKEDARDRSEARLDFIIETDNGPLMYDVTITEPNPTINDHWKTGGAVDSAWETKKKRYVNNWENFDQEDLIPLAFSSYGEWDPRTFNHLRELSATIAGNDDRELASRTFTAMRQRIAMALTVSQYRLIHSLNRRNGFSIAQTVADGG